MADLPEQQARQTIDAMLAAAAPGALVWPTVRLGDYVTKIGSGSTPRGGEAVYVKNGVPLIRSMNVHFDGLRPDGLAHITKADAEKLKSVTVQEGDVLLNITGASIGRVTTVPGELAGSRVNQHVCIIRPTSALLPKFLAYFFATPVEQIRINQCQVGATRQALTKQMIEDWQVPLPPLEEQQRIVAETEKQFTRLEVGLAALRRVQANLKRYRAAVLKAACEGRLVLTEAELARAEGHPFESGQQLLARILTERRQNWHGRGEYKEPEIPDSSEDAVLPAGWTYASVETVGFVQLGRQRAPKHHSGSNMRPYLRVANVYEDRVDLSDVKEMNFTPEEFEVFKLVPNDILLNEGQSLELVGRPAIYRDELPGACFTNTLVRFRPCPSLGVKFALSVFRAYLHSGRFQKIAKWTTNIAHLGTDRFAKLPFPLPPLAEQTRIVAEVERRLSVVEELEVVVSINLQRAKRLRGSILASGFRSERSAELYPQKAKVKPTPGHQTEKRISPKISPMKKQAKVTPESLVETVRRNKGKMTPSDLCLASNVEEEVEAFFEVLRECRDRGLLIVPSGIGATIKLAKS